MATADAFTEQVGQAYRQLLRDGFVTGEEEVEYTGRLDDPPAKLQEWQRTVLRRWFTEVEALATADGLWVECFVQGPSPTLVSVGVDNEYPVAMLGRPDRTRYPESKRLPPRFSEKQLKKWRKRISEDWGDTLTSARKRAGV
jgi:hypothetical protein